LDVTLHPCPKCPEVFKTKSKNKINTFSVEFICVGFHGKEFRPMNVFVQAKTMKTGRLLTSAVFVLKGSRKKVPNSSDLYFKEKANQNPPPAPTVAAHVPTSMSPLAQDPQPTTDQDNQDPRNRANPPPPTLTQELSAPTNPGVQTCNEGFSSLSDRVSFDGQEPDWDFGRGRIDN